MSQPSHSRYVVGYISLLSVVGAVIAISLVIGSYPNQTHVPGIAGEYEVSDRSACLGSTFQLQQSGRYVNLDSGAAEENALGGSLTLTGDRLSGGITCMRGLAARLDARVEGELTLDQGGEPLTVPTLESVSIDGEPSHSAKYANTLPPIKLCPVPEEGRSPEEALGRLMLAIAAVVLTARLVGASAARIGQPRVMGEVLAGILLGPTLLGQFAPSVECFFFPADIVTLLRGAADIGLVFYMFLVGLELDPEMLKGRAEQAAFISHGSIAVPMALGVATAVPLFRLVGPSSHFAPYALFMGVAMSITAFPVLARILLERRMLKNPLGAMAIGAAAVDDVTAWTLIALSTAVAVALGTPGAAGGGGANFLCTRVFHLTDGFGKPVCTLTSVLVLLSLFCLVMALGVRKLLGRVSNAYDEAGHVPPEWIAAIFLGVLISAYAAVWVGVAGIFGAFVMGLIMPRRAGLTHDVSRRLEDFVAGLLLPLFFVVSGLSTQLGLLNNGVLWLVTLLLIAVAVFCKWVGAAGASRYTGIPWRRSAALGALMNTRGLTELIVLNIGLGLGVLTPALFTMLVIMALVTTFMTGPTLHMIDPSGELSREPEEELREAEEFPPRIPKTRPERAILIAPQDAKNARGLLSLATPLARSEPERALILARLVPPSRSASGLARDERELEAASRELQELRTGLLDQGVWTKSVAFTSRDVGADLVRLAAEHAVDIVVIDGRRPLLREGPPGGAVGKVLAEAESDVAVLVERRGDPSVGIHRPVMVAFGGAEHDWAALELGAWIATVREAPLVLLGSEADVREGTRDASRLLGNASLAVQQLVGIPAEPRLVPAGREGIIEAAREAGLLVLGLSDRWREEGLGEVRAAIARTGPAPTVFVRRGRRPGALAPREDVTRFTWSRTFPPSRRAPGD